MSGPLEGKHALVTGGGRGIGRGSAIALACAGARVTVAARSADEIERVADEIGGNWLAVDVTDARAVEQMVADVGELDIVVNSAGTNRPGPTVGLAPEDFDFVMEVNVRGTFLVCRAAGAAMLAAGRGGRIINVSSQMGAVGYPGRAAYCASKHAVNGLTKALAVEWAPHGITVNAVSPTFIDTPLTVPMLADEAFRAEVLRRIPMGRIGAVDEVADPIVFLASPGAALITGAIVPVDGGWVAW